MQDGPERLYVVVRGDLPPGHQATQSVHAALLFSVLHPAEARSWHTASGYLVVLSCTDADELERLEAAARRRGVRAVRFEEVDFPEGERLTALALGPGDGARRLCSNLPLLGRKAMMRGRFPARPGEANVALTP